MSELADLFPGFATRRFATDGFAELPLVFQPLRFNPSAPGTKRLVKLRVKFHRDGLIRNRCGGRQAGQINAVPGALIHAYFHRSKN